MSRISDAPVRSARILPPDVVIGRDELGRLRARSPHALGAYPATLTERLVRWAERSPDRTFLAERAPGGGWRRLTYAAALDQARRVGQALVDRKLSAERPVVILSGNSLEHAVLALAAMYVGVPHAPIAPAYSLVSRDYGTLESLRSVLQPGLVFAADGPLFERVLRRLSSGGGTEVVTPTPLSDDSGTLFATLLETTPRMSVDNAHRNVGPDTIAKILFTSGSTGQPKGVINTQRMLTSNQEQLRTVMTFLQDEPPILCDWLPWNHTFGGNHNFGLTLYNGGTMYIDAGTPTSDGFAETLTNLREVATTAYFNVPKGYDLLLPALEADPAFAKVFFSRVKMLFYAAAGLRQEVSDEIDRLAVKTCGERIPWVSGLGATESAPFALCTGAMPEPVAGRVGVPVPGVELKAEPVGALLEARVRGPNVTPGYWKDPELTKASFDADGFFCMGDAIALADATDPLKGFAFQGRLTEDFKLSTGTWVRVGPLRAAFIAHMGSLVHDVVIAGHDRDDVRMLVFPNLATCRSIAAGASHVSVRDVLTHTAVRERFASALTRFSSGRTGSSTSVECIILLEVPPSIDAGEITDKGSLNQHAVLSNRRTLVDQLYGAPGSAVRIPKAP